MIEQEKKGDVVVWIRLPKEVAAEKIKELTKPESACGGNTICIAAASFDTDASIVIQRDDSLDTILKKAGFNPAARCFGGDTCIV